MLSIFTWDPEMPYAPFADDASEVSSFAGSGSEQRGSLFSREFWRWPLTFLVRQSDRDAMLAFWKARRGNVGAFYWKDHNEYARTGIALTPASDGVLSTFALPKSGQYGGDYPISDAHLVLKRAAVANGGTISADTDARTISTTVVPVTGGAMTADYWFYRRVRFETSVWNESMLSRSGTFRITLALREVQG